MIPERKKIINHISRLEGQLASIKAEIRKPTPDCVKASQTLHSAARSFAGLREQFVESFLYTHFIKQSAIKDKKLFEQLIALIRG